MGYPAGTYNAQMATVYGRLQWTMMHVCWQTWNAWSGGKGTPYEKPRKKKPPQMDIQTSSLRMRLLTWWRNLIKQVEQGDYGG